MSDYYAPTAYDSTRPRELPPRVPLAQLKVGARAMRKGSILPWGIYVGDYRNTNAARDIRTLRKTDEQAWAASVSPERLHLATIYNPKATWKLLRGLAGLFFLVGLITDLGVWFAKGGWSYFEQEPYMFLYPGIPLVIVIVISFIIPFATDKNDILLNRRAGMVTLPLGFSEKKRLVLPFDEFDPYLRWYSDGKIGAVYWRLHLGHRASNYGFDFNIDLREPAEGYQNWEFIQQFMDISKPLPDTALLEPVRRLDPTTAAYDQQVGRPCHFWRDREPDEVGREIKAVEKTISGFPWSFLPHDIEPYEQYGYLAAWREVYPEHAKIADGLKRKGWWEPKEEDVSNA